MASYQPYPTVPSGPVQMKRKYRLWLVILLILICWPAALVYYFTRPKVPVQQLT